MNVKPFGFTTERLKQKNWSAAAVISFTEQRSGTPSFFVLKPLKPLILLAMYGVFSSCLVHIMYRSNENVIHSYLDSPFVGTLGVNS
jgi:hypothetical protein